MVSQVYELVSITTYSLMSLILTHMIFLFHPKDNRLRLRVLRGSIPVISFAVCYLMGREVALLLLGVLLGVYLFVAGTGGRRRYFRVLEVFPIIGICRGLILPLEELPPLLFHFSETTTQVYATSLCAVLLVSMVIFLLWGEGSARHGTQRHLEYWERTLLYIIGMLMFLFASPDTSFTQIGDAHLRALSLRSTVVSAVICFIVTLSVIILILQGNRNEHIRRQVLDMQHNIIITMADIIENRDENTGGHIRRTAKYVEIIARTLKEDNLYGNILTDRYIQDMQIAAPLHDIGKIHIPDAVLKKEGNFTEEEYEIMKKHCDAGRKLLMKAENTLGKSSYLDMAIQMAGSHHEWWDGSGYPDGLQGQDIPLCARVMAVADVFDALVSKRCYKDGMPLEEAYNIIEKGRGTHFDPVVVDAFLKKKTEIGEVLAAFQEPKPEEKATA